MSAMQFGKTDINIQNKIHTMKMTKTKLAKGFTLVELLVVIAIIAALAALSTPVVLKQQKKASLAEAINNAKQISYLMRDWDDSFGTYPEVAATNDGSTITVTTSNDIFRKFKEFSKIDGEEIFYAKTSWNKKPDGDTTNLADFSEQGAAGFMYVSNMNSSKPDRAPILTAPNKAAGNTSVLFDAAAYGGSMVYLCIDGSVQTLPIKLNEQATVKRGAANPNILDITNTGIFGDVTSPPVLIGASAKP